VHRTAQLNTIHNVVEERKTLKRSNSFTGKLAGLSIGKRSPLLKKKGLTRSVSFTALVFEEVQFEAEEPEVFDAFSDANEFPASQDGFSVSPRMFSSYQSETIDYKQNVQLSPTSTFFGDISSAPALH